MDSQHATLDDLNDQGHAREVHDHPHGHPSDGPARHYITNGHDDGGTHSHIHVRSPSSVYDHHDFGPVDPAVPSRPGQADHDPAVDDALD